MPDRRWVSEDAWYPGEQPSVASPGFDWRRHTLGAVDNVVRGKPATRSQDTLMSGPATREVLTGQGKRSTSAGDHVLELRERPRDSAPGCTPARLEPVERNALASVDLRPPVLGAFPGAGDPVDDLGGAVGVAGLAVEELDEHGVGQSLDVGG